MSETEATIAEGVRVLVSMVRQGYFRCIIVEDRLAFVITPRGEEARKEEGVDEPNDGPW